jgi:hypothetical protein
MFPLSKLLPGMPGALFRQKSRHRVTPISFQPGKARNALSREIEVLISTRARCAALVGVLWVFGILNAAGIAWALCGRLDVQAYVADGSVFGCRPTIVDGAGR